MRMYKAEIEDDNFEIIIADDDKDARKQYWDLEEHGHNVLELYEIDENYDFIRKVL